MFTASEIKRLASDELQLFFEENSTKDPTQVALAWKGQFDLSAAQIVSQLAARKKAADKLPSLLKKKGLVFPPPLSLEQCSSEETARYKANLLPANAELIDFTGGFGIDSYYFSLQVKRVIYLEQQDVLCELAKHNLKQLGAVNIEVRHSNLESHFETWAQNPTPYVYLDPARRDEHKNKVVLLESCSPDISTWIPKILHYAAHCWVKLSPLLDISLLLTKLGDYVQCIHIVAVKNDCKELLVHFTKNPENPTLVANNLNTEQATFTVPFGAQGKIILSAPLKYIYEPNVAVMKSGYYNMLCEFYNLKKLNQHTHLFTSDELYPNFPGRIFLLKNKLTVDKKQVHNAIPSLKANISVRNFPLKPEELYTKLKLKTGGSDYLIAVSLMNEKCLLHCEKAN